MYIKGPGVQLDKLRLNGSARCHVAMDLVAAE